MTTRTHDELAVAASLAVRVDAQPVRDDGTTPTTYASSGRTFARRIAADPACVVDVACEPAADGAPAPFRWVATLKAGGVRRTRYTLWLREAPQEVAGILAEREAAARLRAELPHHERKKKPWGPL